MEYKISVHEIKGTDDSHPVDEVTKSGFPLKTCGNDGKSGHMGQKQR